MIGNQDGRGNWSLSQPNNESEFRMLTFGRTTRVTGAICRKYGYSGDSFNDPAQLMGTLEQEIVIVHLAVEVGQALGHQKHRNIVEKLVRRIVLNSEGQRE